MLLGDLAGDLTLPDAARAIEIRGITADSRAAAAGFLFAALRGATADGASYVADAVARGAVAIVADSGAAIVVPPQVPVVRTDDPRRAFALIAARFYPRQPDKLVAVTGTSGKTSVVDFTRQIFTAAGKNAASVGTLGVVTPGSRQYGSLTTPDPASL